MSYDHSDLEEVAESVKRQPCASEAAQMYNSCPVCVPEERGRLSEVLLRGIIRGSCLHSHYRK